MKKLFIMFDLLYAMLFLCLVNLGQDRDTLLEFKAQYEKISESLSV